jgi:hypothetical protein
MSTSTWSTTLNLAGVAARNVGTGYSKPATGAYKVKIVAAEPNKNNDTGEVKSVKFQTIITEGEYAGLEVRVYLGLDTSKPGNLRSWKTAMLSVGYQTSQIEAGDITISDELFVNKEAYVYFKAADGNTPESQDERQFITSVQYNDLNKSKVGSTISASASVPSMTVAAPKPSAGAGLRNMLGK